MSLPGRGNIAACGCPDRDWSIPLNSKLLRCRLEPCGWYDVAVRKFLRQVWCPNSSQRFRVWFLGTASVALISAQAQTASVSRLPIAVETITGSQSLRDGIELQADTASLRINRPPRRHPPRTRCPRWRSPRGRFLGGPSWSAQQVRRCGSREEMPPRSAFRTASLDVRVERTPLRLVVRDLDGNIISPTLSVAPHLLPARGLLRLQEHARSTSITSASGQDRFLRPQKNQAYTLWNTDIRLPGIRRRPSIKASRSSWVSMAAAAMGSSLDNTWRTWFDFGKQSRDSYSSC